jgi:hypothetical protein
VGYLHEYDEFKIPSRCMNSIIKCYQQLGIHPCLRTGQMQDMLYSFLLYPFFVHFPIPKCSDLNLFFILLLLCLHRLWKGETSKKETRIEKYSTQQYNAVP